MTNARRRSNSSLENAKTFKSKFETIDTEPVFEEEIHGDGGVDHYNEAEGGETAELDKAESFDSTSSDSSAASVDMEAAAEPKV